MTTKPDDLIRELRSEIGAGFTAMDQAADLIEELLAQNRRLRTSADEDYIARREDMRKRIIELESQNRRLQEAFQEIVHIESGSIDAVCNWERALELARRALEDKP